MGKKLTKTAQWMIDHPDDTPPPADPYARNRWRQERFQPTPGYAKREARKARDRERYEAAMAETRKRREGCSAH